MIKLYGTIVHKNLVSGVNPAHYWLPYGDNFSLLDICDFFSINQNDVEMDYVKYIQDVMSKMHEDDFMIIECVKLNQDEV